MVFMSTKSIMRRYKSYTCSKCNKPYTKCFKAEDEAEIDKMVKEFKADESICLRCAGKSKDNLSYRLSNTLGVKGY